MKKIVEPEPLVVREKLKILVPQMSEQTLEQFVRYYELLIDWNNRMNLTAITDPVGVVQRHFADSLAGIELIPVGARCIDVGTGAGFPGIPLKLMRPDIKLTLLDSLAKRIGFLDTVKEQLGIEYETVHLRAEDGGQEPKYREKFDIALSRAVAGVNVLAEWTIPFVKKGGASLMYKGPSAEQELSAAQNALKELECEAEINSFPAEWGERKIICVRKIENTKAKYPRKAGTAEKKPL